MIDFRTIREQSFRSAGAERVLGLSGQITGWSYDSNDWNIPTIWLLGRGDFAPYPMDAMVKTTALRHGNFDYVTNSVAWDPNIAKHDLPARPRQPSY